LSVKLEHSVWSADVSIRAVTPSKTLYKY